MFITILLGILIIFLIFIEFTKNSKPKEYKIIIPQKVTTKRKKIERDRYNKKKIPKDIDVIVIGSGIGGLSTAAFLSRVGKKVLVLEQHYIAGGCTHSFDEKGIEHETGIQILGFR